MCNTEGIDIDTIEKETGNSPLIFAANTDQPEIMEELLRHHNRFDINHRNNNMESVMLIVCRYHRLEMVRLLCVIPGIELDCKDTDGNNLLLLAAKFDGYSSVRCIDIVKELLKYPDQIDINHRNYKQETALYWAVQQNNLELVKLLCSVENRMDWKLVNTNSNTGNEEKSPFQLALSTNKKEIIQILLRFTVKKRTMENTGKNSNV